MLRAARGWRHLIEAIAGEGGLVRSSLADVARLSAQHRLTAYDAAYFGRRELRGSGLVSCDVKDLVSGWRCFRPARRHSTSSEGPGAAGYVLGPRNL